MEELLDATLGAVVGYLAKMGLLGGMLATVGGLAILSKVHAMSHVLVRKVSYSLRTSKRPDGSRQMHVKVLGSRLWVSVSIYYKRK